MAVPLKPIPPLTITRLRRGHVFAVLALLAFATGVGFWYWSSLTQVAHLNLAAGVELRYRRDMSKILCEEAAQRQLKITMQSAGGRTLDTIEAVDAGTLDAAVIPAGLSILKPNVRQVALLECEVMHLFVRPGIYVQGVPGLRGKRLNLGAPNSGAAVIAAEILKFIGLEEGRDYQNAALDYKALRNVPASEMPDGVFSLSPLPSPMGERLVQQYGYRLMELPCGESLALRKPYLEEASIPANTYSVDPPVPDKKARSVGTRAVLIANSSVSKIAVRRLLKVLYESDFARRAGMEPLNVKLLQHPGEYPNHAGTMAYLHQHDPWISKDLVDNINNLKGAIISVASALVLALEWYRRRRGAGIDDYLRACNQFDLNALRAASRGEFTELELQACLAQLAELKMDLLEKHSRGMFRADRQFADLVARIESLQQTLPCLVSRSIARDAGSPGLTPSRRKVA